MVLAKRCCINDLLLVLICLLLGAKKSYMHHDCVYEDSLETNKFRRKIACSNKAKNKREIYQWICLKKANQQNCVPTEWQNYVCTSFLLNYFYSVFIAWSWKEYEISKNHSNWCFIILWLRRAWEFSFLTSSHAKDFFDCKLCHKLWMISI